MCQFPTLFKRFALLTSFSLPPVNLAQPGMRPKSPFLCIRGNSFPHSPKSAPPFSKKRINPHTKTYARRPTHRISRPVAQFAQSASIFLFPTAKSPALLPSMVLWPPECVRNFDMIYLPFVFTRTQNDPIGIFFIYFRDFHS